MSGLPFEMAIQGAKKIVAEVRVDEPFEIATADPNPVRYARMGCKRERLAVEQEIDRIRAGGGTDLLATLKVAFVDLAATPATRKHAIFFTDGVGPTAGLLEQVFSMTEAGITLSIFGLGASADAVLLEQMATRGHGRFYRVETMSQLPALIESDLAAVRSAPLALPRLLER